MKRWCLGGWTVLLLFFFQCADPVNGDNSSDTQHQTPTAQASPLLVMEKGEQLTRFQDEETGKFGYKNAKEEVVVVPVYDGAMLFQTTMPTRVMMDNKFGYIGTDGTLIIPVEYRQAYSFEKDSKGNLTAKVSKKEQSFYIDIKGICVKDCVRQTTNAQR